MKKIISLLVSLTLMLSIVPMTVMAEDTGWDGTMATECTNGDGLSAETAYKISTPEELAWARNQINAGTAASAYFELTADIDLNNQEWVPIGTSGTPFKGKFYGKGHVVKNIKITTSYELTGFFGCADNPSVITELGLDNLNIEITPTADGKTTGGFIGRLWGTVTSCFVKNSAVRNVSMSTDTPRGIVAAFIGSVRTNSNITDCYVYNTEVGGPFLATVSGFIGSFMRDVDATVVKDCYAAKITENPPDISGTGPRYAFAQRGSSNQTSVVNCWSTFNGGDGTFTGTDTQDKKSYVADSAMGIEGATREGIVNALVNGTNTYAVDNSINNGYPCLNFEKWDGTPAAEIGGSGTEGDPYVIYNAAQLAKARDMINSGVYNSDWYELRADIDLNNAEWEPIGLDEKATFGGTFNGNGHVIKNARITCGSTGVIYESYGFFGSIFNGTVTDLGLDNITVEISNHAFTPEGFTAATQAKRIGGFVGYLQGTVKNCFVKNSTVKIMDARLGYENVGAFAGVLRRTANYEVTIENCYAHNIKLHGGRLSNQAGFLAGSTNNFDALVKNCYSSGVELDSDGIYGVTWYKISPLYAFSKAGDNYTRYEDCYSADADVEGTETNTTYAYAETKSRGTTGASVKTINDELVTADGEFKTDVNINGGYPSLKYETVTVEKPYVISAVSSGSNMKITLAQRTAVSGAKVYLATYNSFGRLLDAQSLDASAGTQTTTVSNTSAAKVKAFVWDGTLTPIAESYTGIPLEAGQMAEQLRALQGGEPEVEITRKTRLVVIGDSIMDSVMNTSGSQWNKTGWEKHIGSYLNDDITVIRHGHSGYTIQHFMEGNNSYHFCSWDTIKDQFGEGDYVIVSLGANDNSRLAGTHQTESFTEDYFVESYKKIFADVAAKGAKVIICTPIPTNGNYNSATGRFVSDSIFPISRQALARVVAETGVECIDLATLYTDALNKLIDDGVYTGDEMRITKSNGTITAPGVIYVDDTHTSDLGSQLLAETIAKAIKETSKTGLEDYIVLN